MGPVSGIAAEERGDVLGKAGDSWDREALGKHLLDHLQPVPEAGPAEDNQNLLPPSALLHTDKDTIFCILEAASFHERREIWSQWHSKSFIVSYWLLY